jgi:DNA-binding FadR family transcriptional regulator
VQEWNLLDPDVIEWRAQGPLRGDQARELAELRQAFEPLAAHLVAERGGALPEAVRARLGELADMLAETAAAVDAASYARVDAEFHALLLQATENRMLEHLSAVVYGALEITGVRAGCEALPANARSHEELVEHILAGDGPASAELAGELLGAGPRPAGAPRLPAQREQ